jgi:hypothetical protein
MKLAILVALLALVSPAFADPKLRGELDALARRIAALREVNFKTDKQAKATVETIDKDFQAYVEKLHLAYKAALPKQARLKELDDELATELERLDRAQTEDERKAIGAKVTALQAEQTKLTAELKRATKQDRDRDLAYAKLFRDLTKQRFEILELHRRMIDARI